MANMVILEYDRLDPHNLPFGGTMGKPRDIGWPVIAYRVTMPMPGLNQADVNPIQRLVVELLRAHWKPEKGEVIEDDERLTIEETTGLPWDIVRCTLLKIQDKGLIDEYYELTNSGKSQLEPDADEKAQAEEDEKICTALVFREMIGGTVLPFVQVLTNESPLRKHVKSSDERIKKLKDNGEFFEAKISVHEVLGAYRRWRKLAQSYDVETVKLPDVRQIKIVGDLEYYYLKCPMAILSRDGDFAIADPFGYGMSSTLETVLRKWLASKGKHDVEFEDWLIEWNENTVVKTDETDEQQAKEPFENDYCKANYPNLVKNLRRTRSRQYLSIAQIYAAIEWAFFYYSSQFEARDVLTRLGFTNEKRFCHKMVGIAKKYGLVLKRKVGENTERFEFKAITKKRIDDYKNSVPELISVFLILLLQMDDATHADRIRQFVRSHKWILLDLLDLKRNHDPEVHGKNNEEIGEKEYEKESRLMREIVKALLPDVPLTNEDRDAAMRVAFADQRQAAMAKLLRFFTFALWTDMDKNLKNYLISTERYRQFEFTEGGDDVMPMIRDGYSALQALFRISLKQGIFAKVDESQYKSTARKRAERFGLKYPGGLDSVREQMITATLEGNDQTLGACLIAFLLMMSDDVLADIAATTPDLFEQVAKVIALRQHGNIVVPMSKGEVRDFCMSVYEVTKIILEV